MNPILKFLLYLKLRAILKEFRKEVEANREYRLVKARGRIFPGELVAMNADGTVSAVQSSGDHMDLLKDLFSDKEAGIYGVSG